MPDAPNPRAARPATQGTDCLPRPARGGGVDGAGDPAPIACRGGRVSSGTADLQGTATPRPPRGAKRRGRGGGKTRPGAGDEYLAAQLRTTEGTRRAGRERFQQWRRLGWASGQHAGTRAQPGRWDYSAQSPPRRSLVFFFSLSAFVRELAVFIDNLGDLRIQIE